ncbi:MAG: PKD domain-containing protein [Bacteroidota bacterium]
MKEGIISFLVFLTSFQLYGNDSLTVNLGQDTSICSDQVFILDTDITADSVSIEWSTGDTSQQITVLESGSYSVTLTSPSCTASDTIEVNFISIPTVQFSVDNVCLGDSISLINFSDLVNIDANVIIDFGDGTQDSFSDKANYSYAYSTPGTYSIEIIIDNGFGCTSSAMYSVEVFDLPVSSFSGLDREYCLSTIPDTLFGQPAGGMFLGALVDNSDSIGLFTPELAGSDLWVIYRYIDSNGCMDEDSQLVESIFPLPQVSLTGLDDSYCTEMILDTLFGNSPIGIFEGDNLVVDGQLSDSIALFDLSIPGSYAITYKITDDNGCTDSVVQETIIHPLPEVNLGNDTALISGTTIVLGGIAVPQYEYLWSTGANTSIIEIANPGFYILSITDQSNGCMAADTILVDIRTNIEEYAIHNSIAVYPNPTSGQVKCTINNYQLINPLITLYDSRGSVLIEKHLDNYRRNTEIDFDLSNFSPGLYYLLLDDYLVKVQVL